MRIVRGMALSLLLIGVAQTPALAQDASKVRLRGLAGEGPLMLTSSAAVRYQEYFANACPLVLAVDAVGWETHAALGSRDNCPAEPEAISWDTIKETLQTCGRVAHNPPCSILAVGRKSVWNGPVSYLPSRYTPRGDNQFSIVLRRVPAEGEVLQTSAVTVGLITYSAGSPSADIILKQHNELGLCRGSMRHAPDEPASFALNCTKAGAIAGTIALNADRRTGTGTASGGQRRFEMVVLPHADFTTAGAESATAATDAGGAGQK